MYALLTQNTLLKQNRNYNHIFDFHNSVNGIVLKS